LVDVSGGIVRLAMRWLLVRVASEADDPAPWFQRAIDSTGQGLSAAAVRFERGLVAGTCHQLLRECGAPFARWDCPPLHMQFFRELCTFT